MDASPSSGLSTAVPESVNRESSKVPGPKETRDQLSSDSEMNSSSESDVDPNDDEIERLMRANSELESSNDEDEGGGQDRVDSSATSAAEKQKGKSS